MFCLKFPTLVKTSLKKPSENDATIVLKPNKLCNVKTRQILARKDFIANLWENNSFSKSKSLFEPTSI